MLTMDDSARSEDTGHMFPVHTGKWDRDVRDKLELSKGTKIAVQTKIMPQEVPSQLSKASKFSINIT